MKSVYCFGKNNSDGQADIKNLLGGKGANLAEMAKLGIPVPAGLTITSDVCNYYYNNDQKFPINLEEEVKEALQKVELDMGKKFGDFSYPLLLSVRSGARISMPGMMETVLNVGLTSKTIPGIIKKTPINSEVFL
jgi:pyruvate,orthophosphate dikinase